MRSMKSVTGLSELGVSELDVSNAPAEGAGELREIAGGSGGGCRRRRIVRGRRKRSFSRRFAHGLQRLGAHRTRRREQHALAETDIKVEQIDNGAFAFDMVGDQIDAEAAEEVGEIGRVNIGRYQPDAIEQQGRRRLDETEAALIELARLDPQIGEIVDREAIAAFGKRGEALV